MNRSDRRAQLRVSHLHLHQALHDVTVLASGEEILGGATIASGYVRAADREAEINKRIAAARLWLDQFEAAAHA